METNTKFNVRQEGEKVIIMQEVTRTMTTEESIRELQKLQAEIKKAEADKLQLNMAIEQKKLETDLQKIQKNLEELQPFQQQWEEINQPLYEEFKTKLKREIRQEKLKRGYERVQDTNERIVLQNSILGSICNDQGLTMQHPVIHGLKKDFDKI